MDDGATLTMPALVNVTNALVSLTNEAERLREENRVLRQLVEAYRADRQGKEVPVHEEGKGCGCEGGCQGCEEGTALPQEEGEVDD